MMTKKEYPILEFDPYSEAYIEPSRVIKPIDVPECCVITFFRDAIEAKRHDGQLKEASCIHYETLDIPLYETAYQGKRAALTLGYVGAAGAAGMLEELIALGCRKFIVCGGAGVLQKNIAAGHLMIPVSAVRDEGTSYHYMAPSREVGCSPHVVEVIENELKICGIDYIKTKTWTTDSFYRETKDKVSLRVSEGCATVEMEAAAFFAVAGFRKVELGEILYGGDDLSGEKWDERQWNGRKEVRQNLLDLSIRICLQI